MLEWLAIGMRNRLFRIDSFIQIVLISPQRFTIGVNKVVDLVYLTMNYVRRMLLNCKQEAK